MGWPEKVLAQVLSVASSLNVEVIEIQEAAEELATLQVAEQQSIPLIVMAGEGVGARGISVASALHVEVIETQEARVNSGIASLFSGRHWFEASHGLGWPETVLAQVICRQCSECRSDGNSRSARKQRD